MDQIQVLGSLSKGKTLDAFAEFPSDVQGQFPTKRKDELGFPHHETIAFAMQLPVTQHVHLRAHFTDLAMERSLQNRPRFC